jgi:hypothetical protein
MQQDLLMANFIPVQQSGYGHGFRKRRSCDTQLVLTIHDLAKALDSGDQIDGILLDFSKAFDKVPHNRLLMKLDHYGVRNSYT